MENKQTKAQLSRYRQEVARLTERMKSVAMQAGYGDALLRGVPLEVYRRCGKASCKCMGEDGERHGPYQVVQIYREGKSRQLTLKKSEEEFFVMAQRYQRQMENRAKLTALGEELLKLFDQMIEARTIWDKTR